MKLEDKKLIELVLNCTSPSDGDDIIYFEDLRAWSIALINSMDIWCSKCGKMYEHAPEGDASCPDVDHYKDDYGGHDFLGGSGLDLAVAYFLMENLKITEEDIRCKKLKK